MAGLWKWDDISVFLFSDFIEPGFRWDFVSVNSFIVAMIAFLPGLYFVQIREEVLTVNTRKMRFR